LKNQSHIAPKGVCGVPPASNSVRSYVLPVVFGEPVKRKQSPRGRATSPVSPPTRRGLSRVEAAGYVGVGVSKFDEMVADGRMPKPRLIDSRKVWDSRQLDEFFDALPNGDETAACGNSWGDLREPAVHKESRNMCKL
jgi:predicted DNA-binding transcriptional regulator AlpA